jgi:hypothetical protein
MIHNDEFALQEQRKYYFFAAFATFLAILVHTLQRNDLINNPILKSKNVWVSLGFVAALFICEKITIRPYENTVFFTSYYLVPAIASILPLYVSAPLVLITFALSFFVIDDIPDQKILEYKIKSFAMIVGLSLASSAQLLTSSGKERMYQTLAIYLFSSIVCALAHNVASRFTSNYFYVKKLENISQGIIISCAIVAGIMFNTINGEPPQYFLGVAIFYLPIVLLWQSFQRYTVSKEMFTETINSLSKAAEYGGYIPVGHSSRVKNMSLEVARALHIPMEIRRDLATASLLCDISVNVIERSMTDESFDWNIVAKHSAEMLENSSEFRDVQWIIAHYIEDCFNGEERSKLKIASEILAVAKEWDRLKSDYRDDSVVLNQLALAPHGKFNTEIIRTIARKKGLTNRFL